MTAPDTYPLSQMNFSVGRDKHPLDPTIYTQLGINMTATLVEFDQDVIAEGAAQWSAAFRALVAVDPLAYECLEYYLSPALMAPPVAPALTPVVATKWSQLLVANYVAMHMIAAISGYAYNKL